MRRHRGSRYYQFPNHDNGEFKLRDGTWIRKGPKGIARAGSREKVRKAYKTLD